MFSNEELKLLSSSRGIEYLLDSDKLDFADALKQLKYERELVELQTELIKLQAWINKHDERVLILVEGRDFAGKGDAIRAFTEHLNPRSMRTVAVRKPTEREARQWYFKRYIGEIPEGGEIVFFNRSWYNRAIVEPVNGFCTREEYERFMNEAPHFERMLVNDGIRLIKFYFSISKEEQARRIEMVKANPLRRWEFTPVDLRAQELWDDYTQYKDQMFKRTGARETPWTIVEADDKREAQLLAIRHILEVAPYRG